MTETYTQMHHQNDKLQRNLMYDFKYITMFKNLVGLYGRYVYKSFFKNIFKPNQAHLFDFFKQCTQTDVTQRNLWQTSTIKALKRHKTLRQKI